MNQSSVSDYIIVGGGLTGCALATRLAELQPSLTILLLEAGPDSSPNPNMTSPMAGFALQGSDIDWAYPTAPIPTIANRTIILTAGKTLGGGSMLNYGSWARGDASDYDTWARIVVDERWSYNSLLPYMHRSKLSNNIDADPQQHGLHGPIQVTSVSQSDPRRRYPLREAVRKAWAEIGVDHVPSCSGRLARLSEVLEN